MNLTDITCNIMAFENGELEEEEVIEFFQELYDTGVWKELQGSYGRMMINLIKAGCIDAGKDN